MDTTFKITCLIKPRSTLTVNYFATVSNECHHIYKDFLSLCSWLLLAVSTDPGLEVCVTSQKHFSLEYCKFEALILEGEMFAAGALGPLSSSSHRCSFHLQSVEFGGQVDPLNP